MAAGCMFNSACKTWKRKSKLLKCARSITRGLQDLCQVVSSFVPIRTLLLKNTMFLK